MNAETTTNRRRDHGRNASDLNGQKIIKSGLGVWKWMEWIRKKKRKAKTWKPTNSKEDIPFLFAAHPRALYPPSVLGFDDPSPPLETCEKKKTWNKTWYLSDRLHSAASVVQVSQPSAVVFGIFFLVSRHFIWPECVKLCLLVCVEWTLFVGRV